MSDIGMWIGIIGGTVGAVSGLLALRDRWKNRHPRLKLFAPYFFTGIDTGCNRKCLNILFRLSNFSKKPAFVYFETMAIELEKEGEWRLAELIHFPTGQTPGTDFDRGPMVQMGVDEVPYLSRFGDSVITNDNPLSGYVCVTSNDDRFLDNPTSLRVTIRDCLLKKHSLTVDFAEQKKLDPTRFNLGT